MKLVRFGRSGQERPGLVGEDGRIRDLGGIINDVTGAVLDPESLKALSQIPQSELPVVEGRQRLGPPVGSVGKLIGIGFNYADHTSKLGVQIPAEPLIFMKATSAVTGPHDQITIPPGSEQTDWEVELAVVIGSKAKHLRRDKADACIAGYLICNDVSERTYQFDRGGTTDKGKSYDSFAPLGPWLATRDEISDPQALGLWLDVNGERMQTGHTSAMIFSVFHIVWYVSQFMTLLPGDIITTGTPLGTGISRTPKRFLKRGDIVTLSIDGLGHQRLRCR